MGVCLLLMGYKDCLVFCFLNHVYHFSGMKNPEKLAILETVTSVNIFGRKVLNGFLLMEFAREVTW